MSVSDDRWTCPECGRTTVIAGTAADTACCISALQHRHRDAHAKADHVLQELGLAGAADRARPRRRRNQARSAS